MHEIRLVDFGFAAKFMENGKHIPEEEVDVFRSNMIFASVNQFEFKVSSRRDDLQSLCYLLVYLFQQGNVKFVAQGNLSKIEVFNYIKNVKSNMTPKDLCGPPNSKAWKLLKFAEEVFSLGFDEQPNYQKLRFRFMHAVMNDNGNVDYCFDWNAQWVRQNGTININNQKVLKASRRNNNN